MDQLLLHGGPYHLPWHEPFRRQNQWPDNHPREGFPSGRERLPQGLCPYPTEPQLQDLLLYGPDWLLIHTFQPEEEWNPVSHPNLHLYERTQEQTGLFHPSLQEPIRIPSIPV